MDWSRCGLLKYKSIYYVPVLCHCLIQRSRHIHCILLVMYSGRLILYLSHDYPILNTDSDQLPLLLNSTIPASTDARTWRPRTALHDSTIVIHFDDGREIIFPWIQWSREPIAMDVSHPQIFSLFLVLFFINVATHPHVRSDDPENPSHV